MNCPICHVEIKPGTKYCRRCAAKLELDVFGKGLTDPKSRLRKTGSIYATMTQRFMAAFLDALILVGTWLMFFGLMSLLHIQDWMGGIHWGTAVFVTCAIMWLYYSGFESSELMATPGKVALGLVVLDMKGKPLDFARATLRNLMKVISVGILFIGVLTMVLSSRSQTLHDKVAKCVVIRKDPHPDE